MSFRTDSILSLVNFIHRMEFVSRIFTTYTKKNIAIRLFEAVWMFLLVRISGNGFFFHFSLMDIVEWTNHFCSWVDTFFSRFQFNNHYSIIFASLTVFLWNLRSRIVSKSFIDARKKNEAKKKIENQFSKWICNWIQSNHNWSDILW